MALRYVKIIRELSQGILKSPSSKLCPSARSNRTFSTSGICFKNSKELKTSCDGSANQTPCKPCPKKPRPCCRVTCRTKCVKLVRCCPPSAGCRPPCKPPAPACPVTCQTRHSLKKNPPQKPCLSRECHSVCGVNQSGVNRKLESEEAERKRQYEEEVQMRKCLDIVKKPKCSSDEAFVKAMQYLEEKCSIGKNTTEECVEFQQFCEQRSHNRSEAKCENTETQKDPDDSTACQPVESSTAQENQPQCPQNRPQCSQNTSPCPPKTPLCPQNTPQCSQNTPQCPQNTPQCPQNTPQCPQNTPQCPHNTPKCPENTSAKCCNSNSEPKLDKCNKKPNVGPSGHIKWMLNSKLPDELGYCGPNRKRPEPVVVELIENQDLHKCSIKANDYIDPCEHKPKVIVTIDRSNDPKRLISDYTEPPTESVEKIKKCELNTPKRKSCEPVYKSGKYAKPCVEMNLKEKIKYRGADRGKCVPQNVGNVENEGKITKNEKKTSPESSPKCQKPYSANFLTKNDSNERKIHTSAIDASVRKQFLMEHNLKCTGLNIINRFKYETLRLSGEDRNKF